jgi:hypothetical protein
MKPKFLTLMRERFNPETMIRFEAILRRAKQQAPSARRQNPHPSSSRDLHLRLLKIGDKNFRVQDLRVDQLPTDDL